MTKIMNFNLTVVALSLILILNTGISLVTYGSLSLGTLVIQAIGGVCSDDLSTSHDLALSALGFIPWHNTHSLAKGAQALNRMYESLARGDPLKVFLTKHCMHLLKPLQGHTGIPVALANPVELQKLPSTVRPAPVYTPSQFANLLGTVGIYVFHLIGETVTTQCGSSVSFLNRMAGHYREAMKGNFIFTCVPIHEYLWTPIAFSPDYVTLFNTDHAMSPEQESILSAFVEQEVRSLEQAYSTWAKPTNYKGIAVSTSFNNWQEGDMHSKSEGKRMTWTTIDGKVYTRASMSAGATELGYSLVYLKNLVRSGNPYVNTDKYGTVQIDIANIHVTNVDPLRYGTPINTQVDTTTLLENRYYLYDADMKQLPYGPFSTAADANVGMGVDPSYSDTALWFNYMHTVKAPALGMDVYIVKGLSTTKIPVVAECVSTGERAEYPSITSVLKVIAPKNKGGYPVLKSMVLGNAIKGLDGMRYLLSYKDPGHLALAIKAYNVHKSTKPSNKIPTLKESRGRTNLVVKYSIVVGDSTVRFCGLALIRSMVERFIVVEDTSVRFCGFALITSLYSKTFPTTTTYRLGGYGKSRG
jgi:hypothetical protein